MGSRAVYEMGSRTGEWLWEHFLEALDMGELQVLNKLLKRDDSVLLLVIDNNGNLPLHSAVERGHFGLAMFLFKKKPEAALRCNNTNVTPLHMAITKTQSDLVLYMIQSLVNDFDLDKGKSIVHAALALPYPYWKDFVEMLLQHQTSLMNCRDDSNEKLSPLSWAIIKSDNGLEMVTYLLHRFPELKFIPNRDRLCSLPIHKAWEKGSVEILRAFYLQDPNSIFMIDRRKQTILHYAAENPNDQSCYEEMLSYLISLEDFSRLRRVPNCKNHTAADVARSKKNKLFLSYIGRGI
ncbi:unnamed protein product [Amaranthus hypochondriacus]